MRAEALEEACAGRPNTEAQDAGAEGSSYLSFSDSTSLSSSISLSPSPSLTFSLSLSLSHSLPLPRSCARLGCIGLALVPCCLPPPLRRRVRNMPRSNVVAMRGARERARMPRSNRERERARARPCALFFPCALLRCFCDAAATSERCCHKLPSQGTFRNGFESHQRFSSHALSRDVVTFERCWRKLPRGLLETVSKASSASARSRAQRPSASPAGPLRPRLGRRRAALAASLRGRRRLIRLE